MTDTIGFTIFKNKNAPIKLTCGDEQLELLINWELTRNNRVCLSLRGSRKIDVLTPSTFLSFKKEIDRLMNELKLAEEFIENQKSIFMNEFIKLNEEIKKLKNHE